LDRDLRVKEFITPAKHWDTFKLSQYVPNDVIQLIQRILLPLTDVADSFCWGYSGSGEFTTKSATSKAHDILSKEPSFWKFHWLWNLDVMPKIKIFLWQLCHNALPSKGTLLRRGIQIDPLCLACNKDIEDTDHIFLHCPVAQKVWDLAVPHQWIPSSSFAHQGPSLREGLHLLAQNQSPHLTRVVLLLWSIWKSHNALLFNRESTTPMGTLLRAKRSWAEWRLRTSSSTLTSTISSSSPPHTHQVPKVPQFIGWKLPHGGFIKINFDGTKSTAGAATRFVLRSWKGGFIQAGTCFLEHASILVAEATVMRDGIRSALQAGFHQVEVEGDNRIVLQAVQK